MKKKNKPLIINSEVIVPCDVDLTLIDYNISDKNPKELIKVGLVPGKEIYIYPIKENIDNIKNMYAAKAFILVWSGSGPSWAAHIVEKLGLNEYVNIISVKPKWYIDDSEASEWMKRLYRYKPYMKK